MAGAVKLSSIQMPMKNATVTKCYTIWRIQAQLTEHGIIAQIRAAVVSRSRRSDGGAGRRIWASRRLMGTSDNRQRPGRYGGLRSRFRQRLTKEVAPALIRNNVP